MDVSKSMSTSVCIGESTLKLVDEFYTWNKLPNQIDLILRKKSINESDYAGLHSEAMQNFLF